MCRERFDNEAAEESERHLRGGHHLEGVLRPVCSAAAGPAGLSAEEKPKLWCSILAGAGMGSACYNIRKARRIREEKQNHEHDEEE